MLKKGLRKKNGFKNYVKAKMREEEFEEEALLMTKHEDLKAPEGSKVNLDIL